MADKSSQLILEALNRAAMDPAGVPLFSQRTAPGLFTSTRLAKQAAQLCKEQDLVRVVRTEARGKTLQEVVAITPKGLNHLVSENDPVQVLENLVRAVERREVQLAEQVETARAIQASLELLRELALAATRRIENRNGTLQESTGRGSAGEIINLLNTWHANSPTKDCPLSFLFNQMGNLTIGVFHDVLRSLHGERRIYLHPWTGPLSEIPQPELTLMVGHEIACYASLRESLGS